MLRTWTVGITAVGSGIGHALIQSLRLMARPPRVVGFEARRWCRSRAECDEFIDLPLCTEPGYAEALLRQCLDRGVEALIPGSDTELPLLAVQRDAFARRGVTLIGSGPEAVSLCRNKLDFGRHMNSRNLPFAATWSLEEAKDSSSRIPFPLVVKPVDGSGSKGVRILHTPEELAGFDPAEPHVVQPYLAAGRAGGWAAVPPPMPPPGQILPNQDSELIAMQVISPGGEILGCMTSINQFRGGVVFLQDPVEAPEVESAARAVAEALIPLGLAGPFNLQGRWTADGPLFYESNPRFTGGTQMRSLCGFREVEACLEAFFGGGADTARALLKPSRSWVALRQPISTVLPRSLTERGASRPASRILVTGASGFLGNEVVRRLSEKTDIGSVVALTRNPARLESERRERGWTDKVTIVGRSLETAVIGPQPFEAIFHLAALRESDRGDMSELFSANLRFTSDLVRYARETGVRIFVFCSSQSVYGSRKPPPWKEEDHLQPETPYSWSKAAGEELVSRLRDEKLGAVSLRIARLYGLAYGLRWNEVPHRLGRQAVSGEPLVVHGTGEQTMDLLHVRDAAAAVLQVFAERESSLPEAVNVGSGQPVSVLDLFSLCRGEAKGLLGRDLSISHNAAAGNIPSFGMDISLARETLGWEPHCDLRAEMRALIIEATTRPEVRRET